ncbi:M24 family metallopeptidase [Bacillus benzoevorans]|uniref:Xaa-Pro aminopeptidase n=1 Tax=Bacillus benzoevorans TaxID=1456 RepID=A0A7X0HVA2_9BACI|nr:Xaa-Pro aminopeptidase [Bacillus benzoevorans]
MIISIEKSEREQRLSRVRSLIKDKGYKALLFAADSYLGKKGSLRYLFDNHLIHRYGYGLVLEEGQYQILPSGLHWCTDRRVPDTIYPKDHEVLEIVRIFNKQNIAEGVVGVIGLNNTMKIEDYDYLKQELPHIQWVDASVAFEEVRSIKSKTEIEGVKEANTIIEAGFDSIIEHIRPGMTEEEAVSVAYSTVHALGARDTLFLTLSSEEPGAVEPIFLNPRPKVIKENDYLIVSLEITGPSGHWVEHSRMFCFGTRDEEMERLARLVARGIEYAEKTMKPGVKVTDIQEELEKMAAEAGTVCGHLTGHGIGMDVIERPFVARQTGTSFIGVEVPGEEDEGLLYLKEGMVISFHPQIMNPDMKKSAYMSDVFVITVDGAQRLSSRNHEVILIKGR